MDPLHIGLSSWIIQDGNYGNFRLGEAARFAFEFHPHRLSEAEPSSPQFSRLDGCNYRVTAKIVFSAPSVFVLDFGVLAYDQISPPNWAKKGKWVAADIYLGVDPFFYLEELHAIKGMPELRYDVRIRNIELETTPWISTTDKGGGEIRTRDDARKSYRPVVETDAWGDDDGNAHYILEAELLTPEV